MIPKVGQVAEFKTKNYTFDNKNKNEIKNKSYQIGNSTQTIISNYPEKYYVNFEGIQSSKEKFLQKNYSSDTKALLKRAKEIAKEYGCNEINELHIEKAALESLLAYIEDLDSGIKVFGEETDIPTYLLPNVFSRHSTEKIFKDKKVREKIKPIFEEEIKHLDSMLNETRGVKSKLSFFNHHSLETTLLDRVYDLYNSGDDDPVHDILFLDAIINKRKSKNGFKDFLIKINEAVMTDSKETEELIPLSFYKNPAEKIMKNLNLGTSMFATYYKDIEPNYLVDSLLKTIYEQSSDPKVTVFNDNITNDFFLHKMRMATKEPEKLHIMILNLNQVIINSSISEQIFDIGPLMNALENIQNNIKIVFIQQKDSYDKIMNNPILDKAFKDFSVVSIPKLGPDDAKQAFEEQPLLMKEIKGKFHEQATNRLIEACALSEESYPEKVLNIMKKLSAYFIDKNEITEADVNKYLEESDHFLKLTGTKNSINIVFDTGKKLKDFLGKKATQKEAESYVNQIKQKTLGTKGAIIYSQDGSIGSGRKFTAQAIAGEAQVPYVEINAKILAAEAIKIMNEQETHTNNTIERLFSILKTQANANKYKSAVLFIEDFDKFIEIPNEDYLVNIQKIMPALEKEMKLAHEKGLNILVLGSINNVNLIEKYREKSTKFINLIEVESPGRNIKAREEILQNLIKKHQLQLAGETDAEKNVLVKLMAETTNHLPRIDLVGLIEKIKTVAFEREHSLIEKGDVVEAYLQLTTGRPSSAPTSEHSKTIVAAHECGHGFNLEYMWQLAEAQGKPWHLDNKVNFITLDPRGYYGGAMYGKNGGNEEYSFEKIFTNLVCDFGGCSAEKHFYNIDGSWGITQDMEMATDSVQQAVGIMGMGRNFGKKSLAGMYIALSDKAKQEFEHDTDTMLRNAELVSDLITKFGEKFSQEFVAKYSGLVGTGDCLIHGDTFREEITDWLKKQAPEKLIEMEELNKTILDIIKATKNSVIFDINGETVADCIKTLYKRIAYIK